MIKRIWENNLISASNVFYYKHEQTYPAYVSKYDWNRDKQVILLNILRGERWHYLALKRHIIIMKRDNIQTPQRFLLAKLSSLFLNWKQTWISWKRYEKKDFCNVVMPSKDTRILWFNQHQKSDKVSLIIYVDFECLI